MEQRVPAVQRGRMRERWRVPMGEVLVDARLRQRRRCAGFLKNPVLIFPSVLRLADRLGLLLHDLAPAMLGA